MAEEVADSEVGVAVVSEALEAVAWVELLTEEVEACVVADEGDPLSVEAEVLAEVGLSEDVVGVVEALEADLGAAPVVAVVLLLPDPNNSLYIYLSIMYRRRRKEKRTTAPQKHEP